MDEGSTIPFIARYRKESTGSLDEVQIERIKNDVIRFREVVKRKVNILSTINEQNALTPELKSKIDNLIDYINDLNLSDEEREKFKSVNSKLALHQTDIKY